MTLEGYIGNRRAHREWTSWNVIMLKWNWNELSNGIKLIMCFEDGSWNWNDSNEMIFEFC
jgi:uncharacterized phage-like protein YoqJ